MSPSNRESRFAVIAIVTLNVVGFGLLLAVIAPQHFTLADGSVFGIGLGLTAYTLGMRHAFDADHIAAIDNTTRKLIGEGKDARSVGFFFSLGHSTVVALLGALVAIGISGIAGSLGDENSTLNVVTASIGPTVAGVFLLLIGTLNLVALVRISRGFRGVARGEFNEAELEHHLARRGLLARVYRRATNSITSPWQMYPVGLLFGLGFDTASEIALLVLAGGAAASGLPFYAILCLPVLFAAGMTLFDTLNSTFMHAAYRWAFEHPVRKLYYNFAVTGISVVAAFSIGLISLLRAPIELIHVGYALVAVFAAAWSFALIAARLRST
ncbi:MAG: HoxN/HupN/NixA family nickel/cobalt transporter [Thermoleophilaceae bacterium]|nr:HoxN/HupN/NixA family nickel/cobalt transporter [Thermoleophilaceae bacterium]